MSSLQEYHNLYTAAFNSQAQELNQKATDLTESRSKRFVFPLSGGASAHSLGVVPEIRADYQVVGSDLFLTTSFFIFAGANANLRSQVSGAQTALRAKEAECTALAQERDRLAKRLDDQEESHRAPLKAAPGQRGRPKIRV